MCLPLPGHVQPTAWRSDQGRTCLGAVLVLGTPLLLRVSRARPPAGPGAGGTMRERIGYFWTHGSDPHRPAPCVCIGVYSCLCGRMECPRVAIPCAFGQPISRSSVVDATASYVSNINRSVPFDVTHPHSPPTASGDWTDTRLHTPASAPPARQQGHTMYLTPSAS